jgi:hypothetical protein
MVMLYLLGYSNKMKCFSLHDNTAVVFLRVSYPVVGVHLLLYASDEIVIGVVLI